MIEEVEEGFSGMDSMFSGFVLDPAKCSRLSLIEKRELVHEIAQWSKNAPEILSSFCRRELLEIICAEMGKQRKYSGYTKFRMIEHLLKLVAQNSKRSKSNKSFAFSSTKTQRSIKRKQQEEVPLPQLLSDLNEVSPENNKEKQVRYQVCQNVACKAALSLDDSFCKRCSCCICHRYDDNKDPSLWLTCGSDSSNENDTCGMSCHLECALKDEKVGIAKTDCSTTLDGSFYCVSCGKINSLMRTWRKQLLVAKETRRVDVLCLRISLAHKILLQTERYKEVQKKVETALYILTNEVGPLNLLCTKMARGIVNRLSCGAEVQKLCASAVDSIFVVDHVENKAPASCQIRFEESSPNSVIIVLEYNENLLKNISGCRLWHRKSAVKDYPDKPTYILLRPHKRFLITGLDPSTEYFCKVSVFESTGVVGVSEAKWITSASSRSFVTAFNTPPKLPFGKSISPYTPGKSDAMREAPVSGREKRTEESSYEYSVRVVKWLEREGHIGEYFRVKFLTWFSLKATFHERSVVSVFVEAFIDDPPSLAGQLIHTFMDEICCEQQKPADGLCARWWHYRGTAE